MKPSNNIWIYPHDTIYLYREPQTFVAFGASGTQGLFPFDAWRLSLAEALAKAGGLQDLQADPASVFSIVARPASLLRASESIAIASQGQSFQSCTI